MTVPSPRRAPGGPTRALSRAFPAVLVVAACSLVLAVLSVAVCDRVPDHAVAAYCGLLALLHALVVLLTLRTHPSPVDEATPGHDLPTDLAARTAALALLAMVASRLVPDPDGFTTLASVAFLALDGRYVARLVAVALRAPAEASAR